MSTSPDTRVVNLLSRWLAGHAPEEELARELRAVDPGAFGPEAEELVEELVDELHAEHGADRGDLERLVRGTLEAVALGVCLPSRRVHRHRPREGPSRRARGRRPGRSARRRGADGGGDRRLRR